jgi:hypothetical protein
MAEDGRQAAAHATYGRHATANQLSAEDAESGLTDALTNLMHFADNYGLDFEDRLENARTHYEVERTYDWDEYPDIDPKEAA